MRFFSSTMQLVIQLVSVPVVFVAIPVGVVLLSAREHWRDPYGDLKASEGLAPLLAQEVVELRQLKRRALLLKQAGASHTEIYCTEYGIGEYERCLTQEGVSPDRFKI
jgi:hypothetical protein